VQALSSRLDETRDVMAKKVVSQLQEFKSVHSSHFRHPAHLAYPRKLRHLLPWAHGTLRSTAFRGGAEISPDERCATMAFFMARAALPPCCSAGLVYRSVMACSLPLQQSLRSSAE
jgi:Sec23/Sec24 helical domain